MSPQIIDNTIPGAKPGDIVHSVTNELYSEVMVIPCGFGKLYGKYRLTSEGKIDKSERIGQGTEDEFLAGTKNAMGVIVGKDGLAIAQAYMFYVLNIDSFGEASPAVIPMKFTSLKHGKTWITQMMSKKAVLNGKTVIAPMFMGTYSLHPVQEVKEKNKWYVWNVFQAQQTDPKYFKKAMEYAKEVQLILAKPEVLAKVAADTDLV
jgi:hypothetical protein